MSLRFPLALSVLCALTPGSASAAEAAAAAPLETAEQIEACFEKSFPKSSSKQVVALNVVDRIGAVTTSRATLYWKAEEGGRSHVAMRFSEPAELRGAGLLMIDEGERNDMFLYLPAIGHTRRITGRMTSSSMFGSDFSYEEFERLQGLAATAPSERLDDAEVDGRSTYVLAVRPQPEHESAYERIHAFIDKESCLTLRAEFYERGAEPRKVMQADTGTLMQKGDVWLVGSLWIRDHRDQTETSLVVEEVEIGAPIKRSIFSQRWLESEGR